MCVLICPQTDQSRKIVSYILKPRFQVFFNPFQNKPCFFTCLQYKSFENTVGKGEIARNEQFLLFPLCFLYPFKELSVIFIEVKIVVCKLFQLRRV